jgi:hypothetical protein
MPSKIALPYKDTGSEYFDADIYGNMPLKFQLLAALYLIEKHQDACVFMPDIDKELKSDTPSFLSIAVQWWVKTQRLYFPTRPKFWTFFKACLDTGARFVVVYMVHEAEEAGLDNHMNLLVYDKEENTFERFEPNGLAMSPAYHVDKLDAALARAFKRRGIRYIAPSDFCPKPAGIQALQHAESKRRATPIAGDIGGWCQSWSTFYADMRLSFPDVPRKKLLNDAIKLFKHKSMTEYIRNYTYYVAKHSQKVNNITDYREMARKIINKHQYKYYLPKITKRQSTRLSAKSTSK